MMLNTDKRKTPAGWLCLLLVLISATAAAQPFAEHSRLASGTWYRIPVSQTGVYRLTSTELPALEGVSVDRITLYGMPGGQLSTAPNAQLPDDMVPCAVEVVDVNGNGAFDAQDCLLFYAEGASVWRYEAADQRFEYQMNSYATHNYYFLCTSEAMAAADAQSLRVQTGAGASANRPDITTYTGVALLHDEKVNPNNGGQAWVGDRYTTSVRERTYDLVLPGIQQGGEIMARYAFASSSSQPTRFEMKYNSDTRQHQLSSGDVYNTFLETFTARTNATIALSCTFRPSENNAVGYLDYIELNSLAPLAYKGGQWTVRNVQQVGSGNVSRFVFTGQGSGLRVWDVTSPSQPTALPVQGNGNSWNFTAQTATQGTYVAFAMADAYAPTGIEPVENQDLHGSGPYDYVIVAHRDFVEQAERLADLHRVHDGLTALVTSQDAVFNEFSSGRKDPMAIRQLMRSFEPKQKEGSPRIHYLLLFGKGTYDNRNLLGSDARTVVTYQNPASGDFSGGAFPTDDIYGLLDRSTSPRVDLALSIGRLPAKTVAEAKHLVDKIEGYMENHDFGRDDIRGDWRNYICLLSDDADPSSPGDTDFVSSSEITARLIKRRYPHFNIDRIYADAYVQQSGADGSYYPDVNNALRQRINYGCLLLNYIGHGSSQYIGTERYMGLSDIEKYTNTDRLTFFVTSTCTFGRYDGVDEISGAEDFLLAEAAGIGVVAAARPIAHIQRFNTDVCTLALSPLYAVGDALRIAKNSTTVSRCITLLGDPALRLSIPRNRVVVTAINGREVQEGRTDSIEVLSRVTVEGKICSGTGELLSDFDGELYPIVFDREVSGRTLANDNDSTEVNFHQQKSILYKGRTTVSGGRFSYQFTVPRDVSYRYDYAKLSHYAHSDVAHATGQYSNLMFGGLNDSVDITETHPVVKLYLNDSTFRNGGITNETPTLCATLSDEVGINAAGSGLGHDITAMVDGNPYSIITLNDFFEPDIADSRNGMVRYTLGKLDEGRHTLTVKCWNIFNFSGSASIDFTVVNDKTPRVATVGASPNPANGRTRLRVEHNLGATMKSCHIDVYSTLGAWVCGFDPVPVEGACVTTVDWDFTNQSGGPLCKGVYIVRAIVTTADGEQLVETGKVVYN